LLILETIDVYPYDLPREVTERKTQLQQALSARGMVDFKNLVIWRLLEEKKTFQQAVKQAAMQEIKEWTK